MSADPRRYSPGRRRRSQARARTARVAPGSPEPHWEVRVPGSKSLTNRALLLAAVAGRGASRLVDPLVADDTTVMAAAAAHARRDDRTQRPCRLDRRGHRTGRRDGVADVWCGMAGTVARFLAADAGGRHGRFLLDADPQLRHRPLGPLLDALLEQGTVLAARLRSR